MGQAGWGICPCTRVHIPAASRTPALLDRPACTPSSSPLPRTRPCHALTQPSAQVALKDACDRVASGLKAAARRVELMADEDLMEGVAELAAAEAATGGAWGGGASAAGACARVRAGCGGCAAGCGPSAALLGCGSRQLGGRGPPSSIHVLLPIRFLAQGAPPPALPSCIVLPAVARGIHAQVRQRKSCRVWLQRSTARTPCW